METARWCAEWADGLITVNAADDHLAAMAAAYRDAGGRGPLSVQVHVSWAPTDEEAAAVAHEQWRSNVFPPPVCWDLEMTDHFDAIAGGVTPERVAEVVNVGSDLGWHAARLKAYAELGFERVMVHHVGQEQDAFLDAFGGKVLPQLR